MGVFLWAAWSSHFLLQLHCNWPHMSRLPICDENGLVLEFTEDKGRLKMPSIGSWQARRVGCNLSDPAAAPRQTDWKSEVNSAEWTLKISNALCFWCPCAASLGATGDSSRLSFQSFHSQQEKQIFFPTPSTKHFDCCVVFLLGKFSLGGCVTVLPQHSRRETEFLHFNRTECVGT